MKDIFSNILSGFGPSSVLDILVVAFLIYKVLGFIRDSRAQQLVKGLVFLMVAFLLSDVLHLYVLNWILKGTMTVGLIAVIVLFQPELRRGLERMGRGGIFGRSGQLDKSKAKKVTDEFVEAIDAFSSSKTGALIVIEREVPLGDIAETGTILDAALTAEALGNIFYAAGCVLPLTTSLELSKDLGTRHRAAIGITENSDAVVLIVSEENGVISVARGGRLKRFLDSKELEKVLLNLYINGEEEEGSIGGKIKKVLGGNKDAE